MGYQLRNYRHRNPKGKEDSSKSSPFFQPVQRKEPPGLQRLATSKEDEKLGTNDARMEKDKEEPMKPVQKKDAPDKQKGDTEEKKEKPGAAKAGAPQKAGPKKDKKGKKGPEPKKDKKAKAVQKKGDKDDCPAVKLPEQEKKPKARKKSEKKGEKKAPDKHEAVAAGIKDQSGKGSPLPRKILAEMNKSFGVDFSNVRIHHDAAAATLCRELNAMAFTHGQDIFFNEGKFNPETKEGKLLLAHELTHVVQQSNSTGS